MPCNDTDKRYPSRVFRKHTCDKKPSCR